MECHLSGPILTERAEGRRNKLSRPLAAAAVGIGLLVLAASGGRLFGNKSARLAMPPGEHVVHIKVLQGQEGGTMVFLPVWINGQGPFTFALDTGASHTLIDSTLADALGLGVTGKKVEMTGVAATAQADQVRVQGWRLGNVPLPPYTLISMPMAKLEQDSGMKGLLGSDILSKFEVITLDYGRQVLLLR